MLAVNQPTHKITREASRYDMMIPGRGSVDRRTGYHLEAHHVIMPPPSQSYRGRRIPNAIKLFGNWAEVQYIRRANSQLVQVQSVTSEYKRPTSSGRVRR